MKFRLTGVSAGISTLTARLSIAKISSGIVGTEEAPTSTAAADDGNQFRYDAAGDQYIFNLGTKGLSAGSWQLRIDFGDGAVHTVVISLAK